MGIKNIFLIIIDGKAPILKTKPGSETKTKIFGNTISFIDDYGIPDGSVIALLLPKNYIPDIIKFKDNP